jgi:hypothetical protein
VSGEAQSKAAIKRREGRKEMCGWKNGRLKEVVDDK